MPRSLQHAALPAQVVLPALPLRRNIRHLSVKQLRVHHVPHNRRHATAAQHTQRHNFVPPLLHNHERNAKRVLAHVLHALEPHADRVGRHALHLSVLVVLVAAPERRVAGGVVVLEEVRRSNRAGVRVAVLALECVQHERTRRQLVQRVRLLLLPRCLVLFLRSTNSRCRRPRSCCHHSHRETRKRVWMCVESTATVIVRRGHRGTVRHASAHTEQRPQPAVQKQRGEEKRMTPRAGNTFTHGGHRAAVLPFQHGTQANVPPSPKSIHAERCANTCVCWKSRKRSTGRHIRTARGKAG
ncbi:hypothetical protein TCDM_12987 [Trypanosoma cruzi Dm28c]|uniref:Uncharacterized protein n=1 Tax=Trypanosoma cruzi Dm28c TaxID=1416333 RepID=V5CJL0_TRYCR|nr:hypothetical protein TCDM_12987 [Trypanosoma cruzi Dm28c]